MAERGGRDDRLGFYLDDPSDNGRMARAEARLRRTGRLREGLIERKSVPASGNA